MKNLFVNGIFKFINKHKHLDHYNQVKIKYGLEVLYHFVTKTVVIFTISYILNLFVYTFLLFIFYGPIRMFAHGLHAKSNFGCWINSLLTYIILDFYLKYTTFNNYILISFLIISLLSLIVWSPADTENEPIISKKIRIKLKAISIIICFIYIILFICIKTALIRKIITFSLLLSSVLINPITYRITKSKYNNYLNYR